MKTNRTQNTILIVEDDAIVASQLQRTLHKMDYTSVGPVATGEEAIDLALRELPNCILMDIKLKGELTGIETADKIHNTSEIPIIYLTAYADQETIERSKDSHTYGFLTKPVRDKELGAMIETAIYKSSTDRSLKHLNQLLLAIRSIDKLIIKESIPEKLLAETCNILINSKDYIAAWISNENDPARSPIEISNGFKNSSHEQIDNQIFSCKINNLLEKDLSNHKPIVLRDTEGLNFFNRVLKNHKIKNPSVFISPIQYRNKFYGYLIIFSDNIYSFDAVETELLQTLAEDVAFALNSIEVEKERILADVALSESEAYFKSLLHSMHEDIIVIDRDYNIIDINDSAVKRTGQGSNQIIGKKCHKIVHNSDVPCCDNGAECALKNVFEEGNSKLVRHIHNNANGAAIYVDVLFSPLKDEYGRVTKVIESIHDVTDLLSTQEALNTSEERIKQIADNIDIVLFTLTSDETGEKLKYVSPAFSRVWGIESKKVIENTSLWVNSIYPKDRKILLEAIQTAKSNKNFVGKIEYRIVRPDGGTRWISSSIKNANNSVTGQANIIGIAEDISERILTENKLKRSEQGYKNLFDNAHDPIIIFEPVRGIILNSNLRACETFGYDKLELVGKSFFDLCANLQFATEMVSEVADNRDVPTFEIEAFRKDGSSIFFEMNFSLTDFLGQKAIISINRNITVRKHTENELRILSEIVKQSPSSVLLTNTKNLIEYANPRYTELTGYTYEEIAGKEAQKIKPIDNKDVNKIWEEVKKGNVWRGEVMNVKKNHVPYWASLSISPIKNEHGKIVRYLFIEQDVTQQKELEIELKLALTKANGINIFKTHLLGNLNHEIRTPMNSIIGFSQIMIEESEDENVVEMSNKIIKSSYRLLNTLNSIIELSDLESERIKVNYTDINLSHFVRYLDYSYKSIIAEKGLSLEIEILKEDTIVSSDEKLLEQIFKNLLDNAIKYTENGAIKIIADEFIDDEDRKFCIVKIIDTGIGIPQKNLDVIFDAFRQISEGVTRRYEGTGLGLTIAQKMVRLLNGRLEVESKEGLGSSFAIILPLPNKPINPDLLEEDTNLDENVELSAKAKSPNILIVEDYLMNVDIMRYFLNDIATMDHTTNYEDTLTAIRQTSYDIILMDINLKDSIGGLELMKEIRKTDSYSKTPIIAITGYTSSMDQDTFLKEGFSGFLAKPFNQKQLRHIIFKNLN
ncbi:MAG: PAS domain S-box protein [Ignavibacteriales bacterium]|nr:PAS domain S-box protein [Ignavibacteriales bacterium]